MASIQEPGTVAVYVRKVRQGNLRVEVDRRNVADFAPAGGAPDGALASVSTPEKRVFVPRNPKVVLDVDDVLEVEFTAEGADGIDVSDCVWQIYLTRSDGSVVSISRGAFANPAAADYTTVANIPVVVAGWKSDARYQYGGGPTYIDIQDDTA